MRKTTTLVARGMRIDIQVMKQTLSRCHLVVAVVERTPLRIVFDDGSWLTYIIQGCGCDVPSHAYTFPFALNVSLKVHLPATE